LDFKQNQKINQVTENTLVVGIDIAKRKHFACFIDDRGRVLQKSFPVLQSNDGFERFYESILTALKEYEITEVILGIGPTVHYWLNLAYFIEELVMPNPRHVKRSKELDDNLSTKHDRKDALVIACLIKDGHFSYPRILKGMEAELRVGSTFRSKLSEESGAVKNMIIR
jgi:transposase